MTEVALALTKHPDNAGMGALTMTEAVYVLQADGFAWKHTCTEKLKLGVDALNTAVYEVDAAFTCVTGEPQEYVYALDVGQPVTVSATGVATPELRTAGETDKDVHAGPVAMLCGSDIPLRLVPEGSDNVVVVVHTSVVPLWVHVVPEFPEVDTACACACVNVNASDIAPSRPKIAFIQPIL